jgi:hypothetical protein
MYVHLQDEVFKVWIRTLPVVVPSDQGNGYSFRQKLQNLLTS